MGETQERERVLAHFSQRYFQCNPEALSSEGEQTAGKIVPAGHRATHTGASVCARGNECSCLWACAHAPV